jgi:hypothetical protein
MLDNRSSFLGGGGEEEEEEQAEVVVVLDLRYSMFLSYVAKQVA